jgi:hypothetical protein
MAKLIIGAGVLLVEFILLTNATPAWQGPLAAIMILSILIAVKLIKPGNTVPESKWSRKGQDRRK